LEFEDKLRDGSLLTNGISFGALIMNAPHGRRRITATIWEVVVCFSAIYPAMWGRGTHDPLWERILAYVLWGALIGCTVVALELWIEAEEENEQGNAIGRDKEKGRN
jgi:hypothetical protein